MSYVEFEEINKTTEQKTCWTKRESDWFLLEGKLLFKNNVGSAEGDKALIDSWYRLILT